MAEGMVKGKAEGKLEGKAELALQVARAMKAKNEPVAKIIEYTGLPAIEIEKL